MAFEGVPGRDQLWGVLDAEETAHTAQNGLLPVGMEVAEVGVDLLKLQNV